MAVKEDGRSLNSGVKLGPCPRKVNMRGQAMVGMPEWPEEKPPVLNSA